jgi:flagellar P-ring protein precursor FlgI
MPNHANLIRHRLLTVTTLLVSSLWLAPAEAAETDDSFVIGTGLVIGLAGTGDSVIDERLVERSIVGVLKRAGADAWEGQIEPGRIAKVIVTAELSPTGTALTITVTAVGDATSLAGGILLATPLRYTDGTVHSVGQGQVAMKDDVATVDGEQKGGVVVARVQQVTAVD